MKIKTIKTRKDCKCDCGHQKNSHYIGEGQCRYCGCTWFHPNIERIKVRQRKAKNVKKAT